MFSLVSSADTTSNLSKEVQLSALLAQASSETANRVTAVSMKEHMRGRRTKRIYVKPWICALYTNNPLVTGAIQHHQSVPSRTVG
jgi:hypothetical protein